MISFLGHPIDVGARLTDSQKLRSFYPRWLRWVIGVMGLAASVAIWWYAHIVEIEISQARFDADATVRVDAIERKLSSVTTVIADTASFLSTATGDVSERFPAIAQPLIEREPVFQALGWDPIVQDSDRESYEQRIRARGNPDFRITERQSSGGLRPASVAPEYVVVEIIVPSLGNESAVGYNVASEARRRQALEAARTNGIVSATAPITLVQETANQSGVLVFAPVYRGSDTVIGFVVAVLRMGDAIATALDSFQLESMGISVRDMEAVDGEHTLFSRAVAQIADVEPFNATIRYAGRSWDIELEPGQQYAPRYFQPRLLGFSAATFVLLYLLWAQFADRRNFALQEVIAQREVADNARANSEERFRLMVDSISDGGWDLDLSRNAIIASDGWLDGLGYEKGEAPNNLNDWVGLIHPDDRDRVESNDLENLEKNGALYDATLRLRHRDGSFLWYRRRARVIDRTPDGHPRRIIGMDVNVTAERQQRELQEKFERQVYDAQKMESLVVLAGGIAHDFNNLLVGVLGAAELALGQHPPREIALQLERIRDSAVRAVDLTNQMLIYAGRGEAEFELADTVDIIRNMRKVLETSIGNRQELQFELPGTEGVVLCDPTQIRQLILNLVVNASEAMNDVPGRILIRLERVTLTAADIHDTGSLGALQPGAYVRLDIVDDGAGFDPAIKERAFDPFFSTKDAGRGLGLASVLGIVRRHGGGIEACPRAGGGTTMRVWLPRIDASPARAEDHQPLTRPNVVDSNGAVLVIDDEEAVRDFLESALTVNGYKVLSAMSGAEGIELFDSQGEPISLVLLDSSMPGMTGLQTYKKLRERDATLPVILMSGFTPDRLEHERDVEGLAGFLQKPFRLDELYRRVQETIRS